MLNVRKRLGPCRVILLALVLLFTTVACGDDSDEPASSSGGQAVTGDITVFAAASLTDAFTTLGKQFEKANPGTKVTPNFAASSALADQIQQGSPADVLATADTENMDKVLQSGDADKAQAFARNRLAIFVGDGDPKDIKTLGDLAKRGCGVRHLHAGGPMRKARRPRLAKAGGQSKTEVLRGDAKAGGVSRDADEADAGLVYVSDVEPAGSKAEGVTIPDDQNTITTYPIAVLNDSSNKVTARAFVAYVRSAEGQEVLAQEDFLPVR